MPEQASEDTDGETGGRADGECAQGLQWLGRDGSIYLGPRPGSSAQLFSQTRVMPTPLLGSTMTGAVELTSFGTWTLPSAIVKGEFMTETGGEILTLDEVAAYFKGGKKLFTGSFRREKFPHLGWAGCSVFDNLNWTVALRKASTRMRGGSDPRVNRDCV